MKKTILYVVFLIFLFNTYTFAQTPYLKSINSINISYNINSIIFKFNKISTYRYIRLSNNYFYIAIPHRHIHINPHIKPNGIIEKIIPTIISGESRVFIKLSNLYTYTYTISLFSKRYLIIRIKRTKNKSKPVVVIDPGHGGKDPGAIGLFNKEKKVVLQIGLDIRHYLKKSGLVKVIMTRTRDKFVSLENRVKIADSSKASVFVSIHANMLPRNKNIKGLMVFFLNTTSDKRAMQLAALENGTSVRDVSILNKIIISLIQTAKIEQSAKLAKDVYKNALMQGKKAYSAYTGLGVKQAPFYVLVGTNCPSILIETAFLSNKYDDKELGNKYFQHKLAAGIAKGILRFLKSEHKIK